MEDVFGQEDLSRKIAGDPLIFAKALIWLFDLAGTEFGQRGPELAPNADDCTLMLELSGLNAVSQEKSKKPWLL